MDRVPITPSLWIGGAFHLVQRIPCGVTGQLELRIQYLTGPLIHSPRVKWSLPRGFGSNSKLQDDGYLSDNLVWIMFQGCLVHIGGTNHSYICNGFEAVEPKFALNFCFAMHQRR